MTRNKKNVLSEESTRFLQSVANSTDALEIIESAWNDLPRDMSVAEREIFFEVVERIIRMNSDAKDYSFLKKSNFRKN